MIRRPPRSTRTDTLFPYTALCRAHGARLIVGDRHGATADPELVERVIAAAARLGEPVGRNQPYARSEEHTSELQSLMRISYAVLCLKKKNHREARSVPFHSTA